MSTLLLQVGQCGIQVGNSLNEKLVQGSESRQCIQEDFCEILVDTENKTRYNKKTVVTLDSCGRGNNWAHGYMDNTKQEELTECLHKVIESQSFFNGTVLFASTAGGTGSGVGSKLLEMIRDEYPKKFIISCPITPFSSGETALQSYNSILSLHWMNTYSDMINLISNDVLMTILGKQMESLRSLKKISLYDLNEYIAAGMSGLLLSQHPYNSRISRIKFDGWDLIQSTAPIPAFKFCRLDSSLHISEQNRNTSINTCNSLARNMSDIIKSNPSSCLFNHVISRGIEDKELVIKTIQQRLGVPLVGPSQDHVYSKDSSVKSITSLSNLTSCTLALNKIQTTAEAKLNVGAYLHWYERYIPSIKHELMEGIQDFKNIQDSYLKAFA